jgi:RNA polymerase sigma-70 factor (sigma-E family)
MADRSAAGEFGSWATAAWPRLLRAATALTAGDHHLAEDLVQVTLTRTYLAWDRVEEDDATGRHPDRYAHRVLVRAFVDETRKPWWRRERDTGPVPDLAAHDVPPDLAATVDGDGDIRAALAALPPDQRAAVLLRHWLDHDVEECARLLGCTPATVRSRTFRGLAKLRALLGDPIAPAPRGGGDD